MSDEFINSAPGDAAAIIEAVKDLHGGMVLDEEFVLASDKINGRVMALPKGIALHSLKPFIDSFRERPERKTGFASLTTTESLVEHWTRNATDDSVMFAIDDMQKPELRAVYDYNEGTGGQPNWCRYGASYRFPVSDEWQAWVSRCPGWMSVQEFAEFLENHLMDVEDPANAGDRVTDLAERLGLTLGTAQKLLEVSRGLTVHVQHEVADHQNLVTGECQLAFATKHHDGRGEPVKIPGAFAIRIPVFKCGPLYPIAIRLRYRVSDKLQFSLAAHQADIVFRHAFGEALATVREQTEATVFYGTPEV